MNIGMHDSEWPQLPILGSSQRFIPRRIWCIGRNYRAHALEMGDTRQKPPLVFSKHALTLVSSGIEGMCRMVYPRNCVSLHHEVELVLALGEGAKIIGSAVGLDMTRRVLQQQLKERRGPWTLAKDFDSAAPIGPIRLGAPPKSGPISLAVNGEVRQTGDLSHMLWDVDALVDYLNQYDALAEGDLIFTGTPAGVGPVVVGDQHDDQISGIQSLHVMIVDSSEGV